MKGNSMPSIYFVHWNAEEAKIKASNLRKAGFDIKYEPPSPAIFREIRKKAPDLFLIDLSRLPSQGRDVALNLRQSKATRFVPIVFVDGQPDKIAIVKRHLPDAVYATWESINSALKKSLSHPPKNPVVPSSALAGYADAPLVKKLGIKPNSVVTLINAPQEFKKTIGRLPDNVRFVGKLDGKCNLAIWFVRYEKLLQERIKKTSSALSDKSGLWIAWPKKASGETSDLTQNIVRKIGLDAGLVDYKVCSIDDIWSGLKFGRRKSRSQDKSANTKRVPLPQ
jgi:CheY-like chemotaxis protein